MVSDCVDLTSPPPSSTPVRRSSIVGVAAIGVLAAVLVSCSSPTEETPAQVADTSTPTSVGQTLLPEPAPVSTTPDANEILATLNTLPVKGRAPKTGYDQAKFGAAWTDDVTVDGGRNGCDTRNDILRRDLTDLVLKAGSRGCTVQTGTLIDPYTATTIGFVRGQDTSSAVQIDHVVALSDAWQKGAQQLSPTQRADFANDPRNLQATDGPLTKQKGDGDAATWLPPSDAYHCAYVSRQVEVKASYRLWVTQPEKDAITDVLALCGANSPTIGRGGGVANAPRPPTSDTLPSPSPEPVAPAEVTPDDAAGAYQGNLPAETLAPTVQAPSVS
ncbi:uncharacterized protein DUF1524 [Williamsia muralis]|uniref:Uncharacterized protein DUF1524 n=1 Tax=Williamsia marianensis TaxID=85044 RepID=A0A495K8X1_WILMA|nr:uncharacterized protein DUF1524 [Williamsia muralis]